ncbi:MAG TPA: hypothetical protein VLA24_09230 [Pseudomonadales bacterium]|nr:hypothetical protein [Pseudomonadales bacterium]
MEITEIFDTLANKGFQANATYPNIEVSLHNRKPSTMEVWVALNCQIDYSRLSSNAECVLVKT